MSTSSEKCTTEDKTKPQSSDEDKQMITNENLDFNLSDTDPNCYFIEQVILNINEENINEIFNTIQKNFTKFYFLEEFIEYVFKIRTKQSKYLISLLSKISIISKEPPCEMIKKRRNDLITKRSNEAKIFVAGSIAEAIRDDSVDKFIKLSAEHGFKPKGVIIVNEEQSIYSVSCSTRISYMQFMAYYGSVKCFKYALIDGSFNESFIREYAVVGGNFEIIHLLEQNGVNFGDCFDYSLRFHRYEISEWIFKNYECKIDLLDTVKYFNYHMLFFCIQNKIDCSTDKINKVLFSCAQTGHLEFVKYLVEHCHADIRSKGDGRYTPAGIASYYGYMDIIKYIFEQCGAEFDADYINESLNAASTNGQMDVVKYLIDNHHADDAIKDWHGRTPLNNASNEGHTEIVKYIVEHCNADVDTKDNYGSTPLNHASEKGHIEIVKYLFEHCNADAETTDTGGKTPLNWAAEKGHMELVKYLFEHCHADVETKDRYYGNTPLNNAARLGYTKMVKYLVEHCYADVETEDNGGYTPLNSASLYGHIEVVKYLVENGAIITKKCITDAEGEENQGVYDYLILHMK